MTLAILCSGQGRQHREMFALTGDAPAAAALFAHAAALLDGRDPRELVRSESADVLHGNRVAQILCTLQALAAATVLRDALPTDLVVAGYSVGEVAAWGVAGLLEMKDTLDLVARRAEIMSAVSPPGDGLLFVRGLRYETVRRLCEQHDAAIAIVNPKDAYVIGGNRRALLALAEEARALNAVNVVQLRVEIASHTSRLSEASPAFREALRRVHVNSPRTSARLLSGIDGSSVHAVERGLDQLAAQISNTVHWAACLRGCIEAGATVFLELGPGPALSAMAAGAYPGTAARCLEEFRSLQGARDWLARHSFV